MQYVGDRLPTNSLLLWSALDFHLLERMQIGIAGAQLLGVVLVRLLCKILNTVAVLSCMCAVSLGLVLTKNSAPQPGPVR